MSVASQRRALERTFQGVMDIFGQNKELVGGETRLRWQLLQQAVPCALSWGKGAPAQQGEDAGGIHYPATIFCAPELDIPPGSRIAVTQQGKTVPFQYSGECARYPTHQQIVVRREARA